MDFETRAIHEGQEPDPATGSVTVPIYQTSTYVQEAVGVHKGYDYARVANPTRTALQLCLASLVGADVVVHSTTKYLGGHSDVVGGFVATNDPTVAERLYFLQKSLGAVPGAFDSWLVLRGIKTLAIRMEEHSENARRIADYLSTHQTVESVLYPGLPAHPGHEIAKRQMKDFGGMISFLVESEDEAVELGARTRIFQLAESLGGVESLIEHPARMTHASTADAPFAAPRNLIRLSVGIESADDLIADLEAALVRAQAAAAG